MGCQLISKTHNALFPTGVTETSVNLWYTNILKYLKAKVQPYPGHLVNDQERANHVLMHNSPRRFSQLLPVLECMRSLEAYLCYKSLGVIKVDNAERAFA